MNPILKIIFLSIFFIGMSLIVLSRFYLYFEQIYAQKYRKPLFKNVFFIRRNLSGNRKQILAQNFTYYKRLNPVQKRIFEHRIESFIRDKTFVGREQLKVNEEMKVLISATAVMLTFGYRDYLIGIISHIIIYPSSFFSQTNHELHNGEFNPQLGTLVMSWEHFKKGYDIDNDNLNLGIHEFAHAVHLDSIYQSGINSIIFNKSYTELKEYLDANESVKSRLIESRYFREYAYTNQFEFVAVLIENFVETPEQFKRKFPFLYQKVTLMLNYQNL